MVLKCVDKKLTKLNSMNARMNTKFDVILISNYIFFYLYVF